MGVYMLFTASLPVNRNCLPKSASKLYYPQKVNFFEGCPLLAAFRVYLRGKLYAQFTRQVNKLFTESLPQKRASKLFRRIKNEPMPKV